LNKIIFTFCLLFFYKSIYALQLQCNFEEVYQDGQIQNGIMLLGSDQVRYQYHDVKLFTLIYHNNKILYSVSNQNPSELSQINHNKDIFQTILDLKDKHNILPQTLHLDGMQVDIEKNQSDSFVKRLAIRSKHLNMCIFFINCVEKKIDKKFFYVNPFYKFNQNDL